MFIGLDTGQSVNKMESLIPQRKKKPIEQPEENRPTSSKILKIQIDNPQTSDEVPIDHKASVVDESTEQALTEVFNETEPAEEEAVELVDQLEMSAPDAPANSPFPTAGLPSHHDGHILPLQQPVIIEDADIDSSDSDDDEIDLDQASPDELGSLMARFKQQMRNKQLKIERKKLYLTDLKKLRQRKIAERKSVKTLLTQLIERQANYENYLKQALEFIADVKERQHETRVEVYESDKDIVELKMKINQISAKLGLNEGQFDQKKMVEIDRLNKKKIELEKKLTTMAEMIKRAALDEKADDSPVPNRSVSAPTPPPPPSIQPVAKEKETLPTKVTFDELTIENLPKLSIKLKMTESVKPVATRTRQDRGDIFEC